MTATPDNTGEQLLQALLAAFNSGANDVLRLFAGSAIIEYPYAASVGSPARLTLPEYRQYLTQVLPQLPRLHYDAVQVYPLQAVGQYFAEFRATTTVPGTGQRYEQDYVLYFTVAGGRFTHYREYWNPVPWLRAFGGGQALHDTIQPQA